MMYAIFTQSIEVKSGLPSNEYIVLDNSVAGNLAVAGGAGYDTTWPGSSDQGRNVFSNGTIPDFVALQTAVLGMGFKNPS